MPRLPAISPEASERPIEAFVGVTQRKTGDGTQLGADARQLASGAARVSRVVRSAGEGPTLREAPVSRSRSRYRRPTGVTTVLAAHCAIGKSVGLSESELTDARQLSSPDKRVDAALQFARRLVENRGWVSDERAPASPTRRIRRR